MNMIRLTRMMITVVFLVTSAVFVYNKTIARMSSDAIPPVITVESEGLTVPVGATDEELMAGMKAVDNRDGDVTASLMVVSRSKFIRPGVCNVKYAAFDSHHNAALYTRRVTYEGYHAPEYHISEPLVYSMNERSVNYLENIYVEDQLDGDITPLIRMSSGVQQMPDDNTILMPLSMEVVNSSGDASLLEIEVKYLDTEQFQLEAPALTEYIAYTDVGVPLDAALYPDGIRNGREKKAFAISGYAPEDITVDQSEVDYNTPGIYKIHYVLHPHTAEGSSDELISLGTTDLYVVVRMES